MNLAQKLQTLDACLHQSVATNRVISELNFAYRMAEARGGEGRAMVEAAADHLLERLNTEGVLTNTACREAEAILMPLSEAAKSYRVHCVSHAHIDMNWMWGYQETAAITVDTFRTVLDLMKEYPTFTYAQSQASTYQIIERYAPEMIEEIKERVHEGRWEVSASTWVENDKNMPNGESLARHILYSRRYLSKLLDLDPETLNFDFEPDTFGHNASIPEICNKGGVKYYFHCRGNRDQSYGAAYRWRSPSGAELLTWRDPVWYNSTVESTSFFMVPEVCEKSNIKCFLSVYGVGDHGGGPTRRDIERILAMSTWPIMPTIEFSTYSRFFSELEAERDHLPIHNGEMNFVFTGCYTSQSRIKMANRMGEDRLGEAELLSAAATSFAGAPRRTDMLGKAWQNVLFNQFHDILPGSGVIDTREYAMGLFQEALASAGSAANIAMRSLAAAIDTSGYGIPVDKDSTSEGAGVGYLTDPERYYNLPRTERGTGKKRIFHLFNTTSYDYEGVAIITVWDWHYDVGRAVFADSRGNTVTHKCLGGGNHYWGHIYKEFSVTVKVPALGYATYTLDEAEPSFGAYTPLYLEVRVDAYNDSNFVLENNLIRAEFHHSTMALISLIDKKTGKEMLTRPACVFSLIRENTIHGMTAWRVGDQMTVTNINETENLRIYDCNNVGNRQWVRYETKFGERSCLRIAILLNENSPTLEFEVDADFHEIGTLGTYIPQLNFSLPLGYTSNTYRYDIPYDTVDRPAILHDVPANSFCAALSDDGGSVLMMTSDCKYGFRGANDTISLDLIRGSYDPDPYPEYGHHHMRLGVSVLPDAERDTLYAATSAFAHPIAVCSARSGKGTLPTDGQFVKTEGNVRVYAVKTPEDGDGLIIRVAPTIDTGCTFSLILPTAVTAACEVDINEKPMADRVLSVNGQAVSADIAAHEVMTIWVKF